MMGGSLQTLGGSSLNLPGRKESEKKAALFHDEVVGEMMVQNDTARTAINHYK